MNEHIQFTNVPAKYQNGNNQHGYTYNPQHNDVDHTHQYNYVNTLSKSWYVDIETTMETPKEVILALSINFVSKSAYVYIDDDKSDDINAKELIADYTNDDASMWYITDCKSPGHVVGFTLDDIEQYNQNAPGNNIMALIAHNTLFDLGMCSMTLNPEDESKNMNNIGQDGVLQYPSSKNGYHKIRFSKAGQGRIYHNIGGYTPIQDTLTTAKSLYQPTKLDNLASHLDVHKEYPSSEEEYGYVDSQHFSYCVDDIYTTYKIHAEQQNILKDKFGIDANNVYSSASVAKNKMKQVGYDRVEYTAEAVEKAMETYYGGMTFSRRRGKTDDVVKMDIKSQYPTASALGQLWKYVTAEKIEMKEVDETALPEVNSIDDLQNTDVWAECSKYIVDVDLSNVLIPTRIKLDNDNTSRVQWSVTSTQNEVLSYNYCDIVGSQLISDGNIDIKNAYKMIPKGKQNVDDMQIGNTTIDAGDNIMSRSIDERKRIQKKNGGKNRETKSLKLVANSLYGCFAERISKSTIVSNGNSTQKRNWDAAGDYYNPHVASAITAIGRLLLSVGYRIIEDNNSEFVYADTDSFVFTNVGNTKTELTNYFDSIDPYVGEAQEYPMLDMENQNVDIYTHGVKKYVIIDNETKEIVDYTEHGLGHFTELRNDENIKAHWKNVLNINTDLEYDVDEEINNTYLTMSHSITTYTLRHMYYSIFDEEVKYGEFWTQQMSNDDNYYMSIPNEKAYYVVDVSTNSIEKKAEFGVRQNFKSIEDVGTEWVLSTDTTGHPDVVIVDSKSVTKEQYDHTTNIQQNMVETYQNIVS